ncbi:MAG TPA: hypothetical protein VNT55_04860 [Baekduia sp.]|nr:hypothetical protein [Baekduia sp.]
MDSPLRSGVLTITIPAVPELAARTLQGTTDHAGRPGVVRTVFWTWLAGAVGAMVATLALRAPAVVGVATFPLTPHGDGYVGWYAPDTLGAIVADAAAIVVVVWACTLTVRSWLVAYSKVLRPPAWTWTALTLAPAAVVTASTGVTSAAAAVASALVLRHVAYRHDGTVRPGPLRSAAARGSRRASRSRSSRSASRPPTRSTTRSR